MVWWRLKRKNRKVDAPEFSVWRDLVPGLLKRSFVVDETRLWKKVCKFSDLPLLILSNCQKPVKAETLALTGIWQFDLDSQAGQGDSSSVTKID